MAKFVSKGFSITSSKSYPGGSTWAPKNEGEVPTLEKTGHRVAPSILKKWDGVCLSTLEKQ